MLEMDLQTMSIEEQRVIVESVEGLEEILLNNSRLERTTRIGIVTSSQVCQVLTPFLREN